MANVNLPTSRFEEDLRSRTSNHAEDTEGSQSSPRSADPFTHGPPQVASGAAGSDPGLRNGHALHFHCLPSLSAFHRCSSVFIGVHRWQNCIFFSELSASSAVNLFPASYLEEQQQRAGSLPPFAVVKITGYRSSPSISVMPWSSSTCCAMRAYSSSKSSPPANSLRLGSGYSPSSISRLR